MQIVKRLQNLMIGTVVKEQIKNEAGIAMKRIKITLTIKKKKVIFLRVSAIKKS